MDKDIIVKVEAITRHKFKDSTLVIEALTHPSIEGRPNYQRLEFLGDRVVGLAIAEMLYSHYPADKEGSLSRKLTTLVRREGLSAVCVEIGLNELIQMDSSAKLNGGLDNPAIQCDVMESIVGAMYIDGGYDVVYAFINSHWEERLTEEGAIKDPKTALQEFVQGKGFPPPTYTMLEQTGPDHAPEFIIEVKIDGLGIATANGRSKKQGELTAAETLLSELKQEKN
jgi:ribonuclease-3